VEPVVVASVTLSGLVAALSLCAPLFPDRSLIAAFDKTKRYAHGAAHGR
jgi:hydrogenase/urease accessory protein HupE